ncbi:MAG: NTP transferase domain-containing protein [Oscillospiraceae bacterium]|nr:NTP transferase domain-containing protein [Oscillospiraceae bacterium]
MKAVILAGGTGSRLRPVTLGMPKPMARVLDEPLIAHNIRLLKRHGITDVFVTLRYLPRMITEYIGDGSAYGVNVEYVYETDALGTAGGVRRVYDLCRSELLVMGGDAATDIDLSRFIAFHQEKRAEASIAVVKGPDPLEYGTVFTDADGRITDFAEKPSRQTVCGELINTGIYILSESVLEKLPADRCDFARDVFPALLAAGTRLYAWESACYWLDVGTCGALMKANRDALDGRIYGYTAPASSGNVITPCCVSPEARVASNARIGPHAVIGRGAVVESGAEIRDSVILSAHIGADVCVTGSLVCDGAKVGGGAVVGPGCVLGENSEVGTGSSVGDGSILWPGRRVPAGSRYSGALGGGPRRFLVEFDGDGHIFGDAASLTCDLAFSLGRAAAALSPRLLYSSERDATSQSMAACFAAGAASGGARATLCDSSCAATLAFACRLYSSAGLFVSDAASAPTLSFFGPDGYPLDREGQRKLEAADGAFYVCPAGSITSFTGTDEVHVSCALRLADKMPDDIAVKGFSPAARLLGRMFKKSADAPKYTFSISRDGSSLILSDSYGERMTNGELLCLLAYHEVKNGRTVVLPENAPFAARDFGLILVRGRDLIPAEVVDKSRDGFFLAASLAPVLKEYGSISELSSVLPEFSTAEIEIESVIDARSLLRRAVESGRFGECETTNGLTARYGGGHIRILPAGGSLVRVCAECADFEAAGELAGDVADKLKKLI